MAIVTRIKEWREIPHEPGNRFRIQKLSDRQLEDAQDEAAANSVEKLNRFAEGTLRVLRQENRAALLEQTGVTEDELESAQRDPLTGFDKYTLLRHGLISWDGPEYDGEELNDKARRSLDRETTAWAAGEILLLSAPELYVQDDEPGNAKNGIGSTNSSIPITEMVGPVQKVSG